MSGVEHPSGKDRSGENFPVGSWLIKKPLRPHVHAFYRFARNADDIADAPDLASDEKLRRLDRMGPYSTARPAATRRRPRRCARRWPPRACLRRIAASCSPPSGRTRPSGATPIGAS